MMSESSADSSSEVNSPVNLTPTENIGDTVEELDKIMEKLDLGEPSGDFMIVTSQDFIKFWGNFFAFVLHVLIEIS
jgi:hypothetical protein